MYLAVSKGYELSFSCSKEMERIGSHNGPLQMLNATGSVTIRALCNKPRVIFNVRHFDADCLSIYVLYLTYVLTFVIIVLSSVISAIIV